MQSKNIYSVPIDVDAVTRTQRDSIAHVGDMIHAIDFDAPEGTPVFAAADGIVIALKNDSSVGGTDQKFEDDANYVEILHENGEVSEYEHLLLNSIRVKVGESVKRGEVIASVGNTGWSECPHLHFMVYPNGQRYKTLEINFEPPIRKLSQ